MTVYKGKADVEGVDKYAVYFDLSGMSREEIEDLMLSTTYYGQLDTDAHTAEELNTLFGEYVSDLGIDLSYPNESAGEFHRPMFRVMWCSLTEDFQPSLELILELLAHTDYSNADMLAYLTVVNADSWDMSRQSGSDIAFQAAVSNVGLRADSYKFLLDADGQDCYYRIAEAAAAFYEREDAAEELAARYSTAAAKAFTRDNLVFMTVANEGENDAIVAQAVETLNALTEKVDADAEYVLPTPSRSCAICIEDSVNYTYAVADFIQDEGFLGRYLHFVCALSDLYTVPTFRFRLGAYTAYSDYSPGQGLLFTMIYSDPNVGKTLDALAAMPQALTELELTDEELTGYILQAYGDATMPSGVLNEVMYSMEYDLLGADTERMRAVRMDIRNATLEDRDEAVEHIAAVLADSALCMAGNEALIRAVADRFDEVISYRSAD